MKKFFSLATIVASLILFSCQKEDTLTPPQSADRALTVAEAQQWFNQQFLPTRLEGRKKAIRDPFWQGAQSLQFSDGTPVLFMPLGSSSQDGYWVQSKEEPKDDNQAVNRQNLNYLLVFKDEQGKPKAQIMRLLPDAKYLKQHRGRISVNDFTGSMLIYDWDDNFITGAEYLSGKSISHLKARAETSNGRLSNIPADCGYIRVDTYERFCEQLATRNCTAWVFVRSDYYERDCNPKYPETGGGSGGVTRAYKEYPLPTPSMIGNRPLNEYGNKCQGILDIWNNYPNNEVLAYIAQDGSLLVTDVLSYSGGAHSNLYRYGGVSYYTYPVSQGTPTRTYPGMLTRAGYYLIPVVASVHTHTPCRGDGTDGVSHPVGADDMNAANVDSGIRHYVVGCGAVAQYNGTSAVFFNIQRGPLSTTCSFVQ